MIGFQRLSKRVAWRVLNFWVQVVEDWGFKKPAIFHYVAEHEFITVPFHSLCLLQMPIQTPKWFLVVGFKLCMVLGSTDHVGESQHL